MTNLQRESYMGQGIKAYKHRPNLNAFINNFTPPRYAFNLQAVLRQEKEFPDVSFYQGNISWDVMKSKTDAVIIRAGQNLWTDPKFISNYSAAKARGMLRGVYWFYDDRVSPGKQAEILVNLLKDDPPEMEIWADWERSYSGGYGGLSNVVAFMEAIEAALPLAKVGMYTGYFWFRDHSNAITNASQYNYLKQRPLWLAWYTSNSADVLIPTPWVSLLLWQRGTPALYYGQETAEIDMNVVNLTTQEFYQRYEGTPPTGETPVTKYTVKANDTISTRSIRNGNGVTFTKVGDLAVGATAEGDFIFPYKAAYTANLAYAGDQWIHITKPIDGWLAVIHQGKTYVTLTPIPEPPSTDLSTLQVTVANTPDLTIRDGAGNVIWSGAGSSTTKLTKK